MTCVLLRSLLCTDCKGQSVCIGEEMHEPRIRPPAAAAGQPGGRRPAGAGHGLSWTATCGRQGPPAAILTPIVARLWHGLVLGMVGHSFRGGAGGVRAQPGHIRGTPRKFPARISAGQKWPHAAGFQLYLDNGRDDSREQLRRSLPVLLIRQTRTKPAEPSFPAAGTTRGLAFHKKLERLDLSPKSFCPVEHHFFGFFFATRFFAAVVFLALPLYWDFLPLV